MRCCDVILEIDTKHNTLNLLLTGNAATACVPKLTCDCAWCNIFCGSRGYVFQWKSLKGHGTRDCKVCSVTASIAMSGLV